MSVKEAVVHQLNGLDDAKLQQVADFVAFLRFQSLMFLPPVPDDRRLAALYAEFAEEDRALAEEGMEEYAQSLAAEDAR